jgi:RNA polymerase sigma-70 factor, ECF subfamily
MRAAIAFIGGPPRKRRSLQRAVAAEAGPKTCFIAAIFRKQSRGSAISHRAPMSQNARHEEFLRLFLSCEPRIFAFIRSLVFARADAEDILQETALVLWEKFDQFEPGTRFDRWAFCIAHYQVMYHRQKKARDRLRFSDELIEQLGEDMVAESQHLEATQHALAQCLEKLPATDHQLIRQRYREGITNRDVARDSGRSESAVSRALNRIYLRLLFCIEGTLARDGLQRQP